MTLAKALAFGRNYLSRSTSPELDAQVLLAHIRGVERSRLIAHTDEHIPLASFLCYLWLVLRRQNGVPVAYLTGKKEFYGRTFLTDTRVLVPRPDTELLIEEAVRIVRLNGSIDTVVDVGTGSGCLAVTLALELPHLRILATDVSAAALQVARQNASLHNVTKRISFRHGNLLEALHESELIGPRTLLLSNPPYLLREELKEGLFHEPSVALDGGTDGLTCYRGLLKQLSRSPAVARPRHILLELHPPTAQEVERLFRNELSVKTLDILNDLAGTPRVLRLTLA